MAPVVIVGSGLAGYTVAREFRKLEPAAPLVIVSRDDASFYSKPMLSNALAAGKAPAQLAGEFREVAVLDVRHAFAGERRFEVLDRDGFGFHVALL